VKLFKILSKVYKIYNFFIFIKDTKISGKTGNEKKRETPLLKSLLLQITLKLQGDTVHDIRRHLSSTKYQFN
jgi:hypothetical protein